VEYFDAELGRLLDWLDDHGLYDESAGAVWK
jgi:arylsulfatase A-like enzyme